MARAPPQIPARRSPPTATGSNADDSSGRSTPAGEHPWMAGEVDRPSGLGPGRTGKLASHVLQLSAHPGVNGVFVPAAMPDEVH